MGAVELLGDFSEVIEQIKNKSNEIVKKTVTDIRDELYEEAIDSMASFYTSYSPKYYKRHYFNFMDKSFKKYYQNSHNKTYFGGIELTPNNMDDIYQTSTDEVFETVFIHGFHGPASIIGRGWKSIGETPIKFKVVPEQTKPSPYDWIVKKRDYIVDHIDDYIQKNNV